MEINDVYKVVDDYLIWLKDNSGCDDLYRIEPYDYPGATAILVLRDNKFIKSRGDGFGYIVDITAQGIECVDLGGIKNYLKKKQSVNSPIIQNIYNGDRIVQSGSHNSIKTNSAINVQNKTTPIRTNKKSIKRILLQFLAAGASIATIWGLLHIYNIL